MVSRPYDHKLLFEWVRELNALGASGNLELADDKGCKHRYRWINAVPLNGSKDADELNFIEYDICPERRVQVRVFCDNENTVRLAT
jgi:hypothetical protein